MSPCAYCRTRTREIGAACIRCRPFAGRVVFGATRDGEGFVVPRDQFHYGEPVQADVYFSEPLRVENILLLARHSHPAPGRSGSVRVEEALYLEGDRLMRRTFAASRPGSAFFRDRHTFIAGDMYDLLAAHGPGRCQIRYERSITRALLAEGSFEILD